MKELVDAGQVGQALALLSGIALVALLALLALAGKRRSTASARGVLIGGVLTLLYPLWLVYNGIEDRFGLDSVAALVINLVLFAVLGIGGGLLFRRFWPYGEMDFNRGDAEGAERKMEG
jgi:hypothetical protein